MRDAGNLLTRANLALPTVDVDTFTMNYPSPVQLIHHLRCMGESNALARRRGVLRRSLALATAATYAEMFPAEEGEGMAATYQVRWEWVCVQGLNTLGAFILIPHSCGREQA